MKPGWLIGMFILFIGLQVVSGICEMSYTGSVSTPFSVFMAGGGFTPSTVHETLTAFWKVLIFDYPFFTDSWMIVRYLFMSVSVGLVIMLIWVASWQTLLALGIVGVTTLVSGLF